MKISGICTDLNLIFHDIFDDDKIKINRETNADDIKEWDSLNNISLIVAIENKFKVKFTLEEILELRNVGDMIDFISSNKKS